MEFLDTKRFSKKSSTPHVRLTQSIIYVPLLVCVFQTSILLIVQYKYLISCSKDFKLQNLILRTRLCSAGFIPQHCWIVDFYLTKMVKLKWFVPSTSSASTSSERANQGWPFYIFTAGGLFRSQPVTTHNFLAHDPKGSFSFRHPSYSPTWYVKKNTHLAVPVTFAMIIIMACPVVGALCLGRSFEIGFSHESSAYFVCIVEISYNSAAGILRHRGQHVELRVPFTILPALASSVFPTVGAFIATTCGRRPRAM